MKNFHLEKPENGGCAADGCERYAKSGAKGYCGKHYQRLYANGTLELLGQLKGEKNPAWSGGRTLTEHGYWRIWISEDDEFSCMATKFRGGSLRIMEHRLVMARHLGRPLTEDETVHHINGDRSDNRIENLQLRNSAHGRGINMVCLDCGSHNIGAEEL